VDLVRLVVLLAVGFAAAGYVDGARFHYFLTLLLAFALLQVLLQSGNVVFRSRLTDRNKLAKRIAQEIERRFHLQVEVIVRTLAELASIVDREPVLSPRADKSKLLVMFLSSVPDGAAQEALKKWHKSKGLEELLEIRGPEIYLYYPEGVGRSKLTNAVIESKLDTSGTARNWNTLHKLVEAGRAIEQSERRAKVARPKSVV
jgi:uncharacterized protein (DUF1697 family)